MGDHGKPIFGNHTYHRPQSSGFPPSNPIWDALSSQTGGRPARQRVHGALAAPRVRRIGLGEIGPLNQIPITPKKKTAVRHSKVFHSRLSLKPAREDALSSQQTHISRDDCYPLNISSIGSSTWLTHAGFMNNRPDRADTSSCSCCLIRNVQVERQTVTIMPMESSKSTPRIRLVGVLCGTGLRVCHRERFLLKSTRWMLTQDLARRRSDYANSGDAF
ncbi:hypothetical protein Rcae01_05261 [Novipirellula caenicola]|uniref:Uncharacterized protein n=1 Tax=Novipirellula caenicola TaxID=1536901 RepID=A0ABP9VX99_9BACT